MEYFILGILFIYIVLPLLQGVSAVIAQSAEYIQTLIAVKTYKIKKQLEDEEDEDQNSDKHYGFYSCPQPQPIQKQDENQEDEEII